MSPFRKLSVSVLALSLCTFGFAQGFDPANYKSLSWTLVGPNRGGRSVACTGVRSRPNEFYFGATGGGLWKSSDAGKSWECVSDGFFSSSSVGAVAVSESNPDVVFAGMGERDIRGNVAEGDGVYKSVDGGKTWRHVGLRNTRTVSRIVIDPKNPDVVFVAVLGHVFGPNQERGVFKSTDGGSTWNRVLFESERAGAVDLVIDPSDPRTLYAATWEAWRTPYKLSSGGPGSKLWKSVDGGATWSDISRRPGLPTGVLGKIGITVSPANRQRLYANVEAADGGIFRSDDAGATWTRVNDSNEFRQRAWYYTHVYADPKDAEKLYCLNVSMGRSTDGGKTFGFVRTPHSDNHDLWISPDDPNRMIESNDGGAAVTTDGGRTWTRQDMPTAQLYHVTVDNAFPYHIYGAQQDNSSVRLSPDQTDTPEKRNFEGTAGGESGYVVARTDDPDVVYGGNYGGNITELNHRTRQARDVDPWPDNPMGHGAVDLKHRFQWTFPIVTSPHNPNVLYTASQYLLKTTDRGHSWQQISPDLTRNDKSKQASSGGPLTQDNTSVEYYDTIFTVAESPKKAGVIWTGSDDGLVYLTQNGGRSWQNVTPSGAPTWGRVSMVEASPHDPATAYVAINNYQNDDLAPYIFRTHDYGHSWTRIVNGIPMGAFARVCREDLHRPGLLYAGTETGVFVSFDDGGSWRSLQQNLPLTAVHDLALKDDDLIAATHGRSFWILKGLSRLSNLTPAPASHPLLYAPIDRYRIGGARASVDYYLPADAKSVRLEFFDKRGEKLGSTEGETSAGFHTVTASLQKPSFGTFPGMIFWSGFPRPISAPPGSYTVRMTVDGYTDVKPFRLLKDPRVEASERDLVEQYEFAQVVAKRVNDANEAVVRIRDTKAQIDRAIADAKGDPNVQDAGAKLKDRLTAVEGEIYQYRSKSGQDPLNFPIKLNDKLAGVFSTVLSGNQRPSKGSREVFAGLSAELQRQLDALKRLESQDIVGFNRLLSAKGIAPVTPKTPPLTTAGSGRRGSEEEEETEG